MLNIIKNKPVFLYLLPFFFVLHGFTENFDFVPVKDALLLTATYTGAAVLLSFIAWLLYKNFTKANLLAMGIMALHFFFGSLHDFLRNIFPASFVSRHIFVIPFFFLLLIALAVILKKIKKEPVKVSRFLNTLLLLLILIDSGILLSKSLTKRNSPSSVPAIFKACDSCSKPDIYFILLDEYAGNTALIDLFSFDNNNFTTELEKRKFHTIPRGFSNYNYTPFSVASILNMNYLDLQGRERGKKDLTYCYETIRDNQLLQFLKHHKYTFYNYSVFDFEGQPARTRETFLPAKTRLITSQTLLSRFDKEIRFNLITRWKSKSNLKTLTYYNKENNENIYTLTWRLAGKKSAQPKFVYTHLMMPHYPYYFDKNGKERPFEQVTEGNQTNKAAYVEYLQHTNKQIISLVDHILKSSERPPIIVLMGDHGFRHFTQPVDTKYHFLNMTAIHLPSANYTGLHDSLSSVNIFRTILNTEFRQQLPYLKDSSSYLID